MNLKLNKKSIKALSKNAKILPMDSTKKIAGGVIPSEVYCNSDNEISCWTFKDGNNCIIWTNKCY